MVLSTWIRSASLYLLFHHMGSLSRDLRTVPSDCSFVLLEPYLQRSASFSNLRVLTAAVYLVYYTLHLSFWGIAINLI